MSMTPFVRLLVALIVLCGSGLIKAADLSPAERRSAAREEFLSGNYRDAWETYRTLSLDPDTDSRQVVGDFEGAMQCLRKLSRFDEIDEFRDQAAKTHAENWGLLRTAAMSYLDGPHHGYTVGGQFSRGKLRESGQFVSSFSRDRVRGLQLMEQALPLLADKTDRSAVGHFFLDFARILLYGREGGSAWRLLALTDLSELPDIDSDFHDAGSSGTRGAPVDVTGNPTFHRVPESDQDARNDGERWRWMLRQAAVSHPDQSRLEFAQFLRSQFGVQTLGGGYGLFGRAWDGDQSDSGPWGMQTLKDDETIAQLASGPKRFRLPDEFNFLRIYRDMAETGAKPQAADAMSALAGIHTDRRQYPRAVELWREHIQRFGDADWQSDAIQQIVGHWGRFEHVQVQPAGRSASVEFRYRNGPKVTFEAHQVDIEKLLADMKAHLESKPETLDWDKVEFQDIGHRLVTKEGERYLGRRVARWDVELDPAPDHFDRLLTVTTPLKDAGAYLLTAKMADGNTSQIVVWIADTTIVRHPMKNGMHYFVADAVTGAPVPNAALEFISYDVGGAWSQGPRRPILTRSFTGTTDEQGQAVIPGNEQQEGLDWLVIARAEEGRLAYLGFDDIWYDDPDNDRHGETRTAFAATDRPVYRPEQSVKFKLWVRLPTFKKPDISHTAGQEFTVRITGPHNQTVFERKFKADEHGGMDGEWTIPARASLGRYRISFFDRLFDRRDAGGGTFRVEEYKKPEFEVAVEAPGEPVRLGEKITATVRARYYFGAPVTDARVRYQVIRSSHTADWWPAGRWDWLYGPGYWWFAPAYDWYPGWRSWSNRLVAATEWTGGWWWDGSYGVPEVVLDKEVEIGPDGSVAIEIDTALAKELHGDRDHRYEITAEVVDRSRRTIIGSGEVLVARDPFQVFAWLDRGYCRAGDTVRASFQAQTLDHKPVRGEGRLTLLRITYPDAEPVETEIESWDLPTNDRGETSLPITATEAGQYRLSYRVTDRQGGTVEGGYLFHVIGEGFDGRGFRYNDLELVVEKSEYRPGETLRLLINTNRSDSTVLLFVRPVEGTYRRPEVLRLKGKSAVHEIEVTREDMPNFFIKACTVSDGQFHSEIREAVVPPEQRVVNVEVLPSSREYKPGDEAKLRVKLTDAAGKPFIGSTVLTVYDKSLEAIAGGPNVDDIRQIFWDWRREHYPSTPEDASNLGHDSFPLVREGEAEMKYLGAFGFLLFPPDQAKRKDDLSQFFPLVTGHGMMMGMGGMGGGGMGGGGMGGGGLGGMGMGGMGGSISTFEQTRSMVVRDRQSPHGHTADDSSRLVEPRLRAEFADAAFWAANLTPDERGIVEVAFPLPENLTTWKVRAWTLGPGTRVGQGEAEMITTKNLLVRMQAPRFFIEKDEVVLSANVHNYLNEAKQARVILELEGDALAPLDSLERSVKVAADGEQRIDWRVKAARIGEAVVRMKVLTDEESDAMEMRFPVHVHGMLKTDSFTGVIRPDEESAVIEITVPEERRPDETRLEVRFSPTLAGAMVDALPYLVDYPYGCTEQTLNRFLPTVITQGVLRRMGVDLAAIREKQTNLNPQELGDPRQRAAQWRQRPKQYPVFDEAEVDRMVITGIQRLTEMQVADGGWGWFSGSGEKSYPHTTAVVVHGLQTAKESGAEFDLKVLDKGLAWLKAYQTEQVRLLKKTEVPTNQRETRRLKSHADNIDALIYMVLIDSGHIDGDMERFLYRDRTKLSPYAMAMFGLALHRQGNDEMLAMILRNLEQYLVEDDENETAYLRLPNEGWWWRWYGDSVEANAFYLKLLARTDPRGRRASRLVKYLINNRKNGRYWTSTRDTAYAIEALAEYLHTSDETQPEMVVEVWLDGEKQNEVEINAVNMFDFDNQWLALGEVVPSGVRRVELRRQGTGPLYYNAWLTNFTLEDFITRAGLEVTIDRHYYRLHRQNRTRQVAGVDGRPADQRVERYEREPLDNLATVTSGDLIEVELIVESKNDYEYLIFEDQKAGGFEPVEVRSGYFANDLGAYMELRDERVSFFVRSLPQGKHSLRYRLRAEIPGRFSALPAVAWGMYAPELQGNSDEMKLSVKDESGRGSRSTSSGSADGASIEN